MPALKGAIICAMSVALSACDTPERGIAAGQLASRGIVLGDSLPAVLVVARRPSISEILDLVLRERPMAAEFSSETSAGRFPDGSDEAHVASVLGKYTSDPRRADRIAAAIVKEGRRQRVGSSLLVGVLLTENPWLDPRATSFVGARGLMQVMPFHAGKWGCGSNDLFDIESNICHGVAVLAENLGRSKTLPQALLGYNGCVRGTNTPDCWRYPTKVFNHARKTVEGTAEVRPFSYVAARRPARPSGS